jgi:hypothetical protein
VFFDYLRQRQPLSLTMSLARKRRTDRGESPSLPHAVNRSVSDDHKVSRIAVGLEKGVNGLCGERDGGKASV